MPIICGSPAWKRARLQTDGVEEGSSLHMALIRTPDPHDAIRACRYTDRRADLNMLAVKRGEAAWDRCGPLAWIG